MISCGFDDLLVVEIVHVSFELDRVVGWFLEVEGVLL